MDSAYEVPDSTDWLNTPLKDFAALESALHCQICKEFFDTPMTTSCSHTFCSKCIRTSLSTDGKCPACRTADQASKLRNNWALQEVVATFLAARPVAISVARRDQELAEQTKKPTKRKRTVLDSDDVAEQSGEGRQTRSKSRRVAASLTSQTDAIEIEDTDEDGEYEPEPDDGLVECLLGCGKRMKPEQMDLHLDRCEDEKKAAQRAKSRTPVSSSFGARPSPRHNVRPQERLAELNYSLLKDTAMRKKLEELGIPAWGSKQLMVKRHTEWVNLWNANCDSRQPRTKRELLADLDTWERTQGGRAPGAQNSMAANVMKKDFDGAGWAKKNESEFSRLIADARRKKGNPANESSPTNEDAGDDPSKPVLNGDEGNSSFFISKPSLQQESVEGEAQKTPYASKTEVRASIRSKDEAANSGQQPELIPSANFDGVTSAGYLNDTLTNQELQDSSTDAQNGINHATPLRQSNMSPARPLETLSRGQYAVNEHTGSPCDLAAHLNPTSRKLPVFAVPEQAVMNWDGSGGGDPPT